jgi:hypothetical protein
METAVPAAEVELDTEDVRELLRMQMPDLAELHLRPVDSGWDNHIFRRWDANLERVREDLATG